MTTVFMEERLEYQETEPEDVQFVMAPVPEMVRTPWLFKLQLKFVPQVPLATKVLT